MSFTKVQQPELFRDHAYKEIKQAIIHHQIEPGELLSERSLSDNLGISRTPLKLALQQLETEGWIQLIPRKGVQVKKISLKDVEEVFQLRKANEILVIELLVPLLDNEKIQQIEQMYNKQLQLKGNHLDFVSFDTDFHMYLAELSNNKHLFQLMRSLTDQYNWFGIAALKLNKRLDESYWEHGLIVDGIKARDLQKTKKAMLQHIENTFIAISKVLKGLIDAGV